MKLTGVLRCETDYIEIVKAILNYHSIDYETSVSDDYFMETIFCISDFRYYIADYTELLNHLLPFITYGNLDHENDYETNNCNKEWNYELIGAEWVKTPLNEDFNPFDVLEEN